MERDSPATSRFVTLLVSIRFLISLYNFLILCFCFVFFLLQNKFAEAMTKLNPFRSANKVRKVYIDRGL